jgi:hypothetical protein
MISKSSDLRSADSVSVFHGKPAVLKGRYKLPVIRRGVSSQQFLRGILYKPVKLLRVEVVPEHKTRLAATTLSRAYHEGKPLEKSISLHGDVEDFAEMIERLQQSQLY